MGSSAAEKRNRGKVGLLGKIRKKLGYAKYVCLDGGHREVRYRWRLDRLDRSAARWIDSLVGSRSLARVETPTNSEIELHILCGHKQVTMALWSLWSLLRWAEGRISLFVHSDGSLTQDDASRFREYFANVRLVTPEEGREFVERRLAGDQYHLLRSFHEGHFFGIQGASCSTSTCPRVPGSFC